MIATLRRILPPREARALTRLIAMLTLAAALQGLTLGLVVPWLTALLGPEPGTAWGQLVALSAVGAVYVAVQWVAQMQAFRVGSETARALHRLLSEHIAALPIGWFTPESRARLIAIATTGVPQLMSYPAILLRPLITALVTPVTAALVLAFVADWRYGLAVLLAAAVAERIGTLGRRRAEHADAARHRAQDAAAARILEFARAQPVLRTQQGLDDHDELDAAFTASFTVARRTIRAVTPGLLAFTVGLQLLFAGLIVLGLVLATGGELTITGFAGAMIVSVRLINIAAAGAELTATARMQAAQLLRLMNVLESKPLHLLPFKAADRETLDRPIAEFRDVAFTYGAAQVIDNVSFSIPRLGLTALVGPSGSGKSTIAHLLLRFADPDKGSVMVGGDDVRSLEPHELYSRVNSVLQDVWLIDGTIEDNVRLGRADATPAELADALRKSGLAETDPSLPDGAQTRTGSGGRLLSGGQRQRVGIARAFISGAPLTILDEATSALDSANAASLVRAARELAERSAVLMITHDPAVIAAADRILRLQDGQLTLE